MHEHDADTSAAIAQPPPAGVVRITRLIRQCPCWSVFWDKRYAVWRAAEDDPDSDLYTESSDAEVVIRYIIAHSGRALDQG
jgi:hypothetical protein